MLNLKIQLFLIFLFINFSNQTNIQNSHPYSSSKSKNERIIGGELAQSGQFPWQVAIYITSQNGIQTQLCGGTLISVTWVLTAASCVYRQNGILMYLGSVNLKYDDHIVRTVDATIIHGAFDLQTLSNDIALLKFTEPVVFNTNIQSVVMASKTDSIGEGVGVTTSGWGRTQDGGDIQNTLHYVNLTTITNVECQRYFGTTSMIREGMLCCTSNLGNIKSTCQGDTGGPLVRYTTMTIPGGGDIEPILVGIVSWVSRAGCTSQYPSGYTRISVYRDWIDTYVGVIE